MQTVLGADPDIARPKHTHVHFQFWCGWLVFTDRMCICDTDSICAAPERNSLKQLKVTLSAVKRC